jgi:citrate lyase subunit beta/citryl-CoA lyase
MHPQDALFTGERPFPALAACEHFAGSEKLILKAMSIQNELGPVFDITCDCEDGAAAGSESRHARLVADLVNSGSNTFGRVGVRIHDPSHEAWRNDVDVVVGQAARALAYVTVPKTSSSGQAAEVISYVQQVARAAGRERPLPIHLLVETHGALADAFALAALAGVEVLDFGQMDFVSSHRGAILASALRSPEQFEHALLVRAKARVVAAALASGVVPAHSVCLNLKDEAVVHADARRARHQFGFLRMWSIHPMQIRPIVEAMRPQWSEVEDAAAILNEARERGWGPIQYKGELHDRASYRYFWEALRRAKATGVRLPAAAEHFF